MYICKYQSVLGQENRARINLDLLREMEANTEGCHLGFGLAMLLLNLVEPCHLSWIYQHQHIHQPNCVKD